MCATTIMLLFGMKRDLTTLQRDTQEAVVDSALRKRLRREFDAAERAERIERANRAEQANQRSNLEKWHSERVKIATDFIINEPEPNPLGTNIVSKFGNFSMSLCTRTLTSFSYAL